jgi:hypothetical protein
MSTLRLLSLLCLSASLAACYSVPPEVRKTPVRADAEPRPIGGDRDAHGCLPAAGYSWCARENSCVRPWELAKDKGFANDADAFAAYCAVPAKQ